MQLLNEKQAARQKSERLKADIAESTPHKNAQFQIIQDTNPMFNDTSLGIRSPKDIKTFAEVVDDPESFVWGDFSREDARKALKRGTVRVYSSYPIKNGVFVSTSYQQALDYAGGEPSGVHSRVVALDCVAWINGDEGQYAKVYQRTQSEPQTRFALSDALQTLGDYDATRRRHIESNENDRVSRDYNEIVDFIKSATKETPIRRLHIGTISDSTAALVQRKTGVNIKDYDFVLASNFVAHIFDSHGRTAMEAARGQTAVNYSNIENILETVIALDDVALVSDNTGTALRFEKMLDGRNVAITITSTKKSTLTLKSAWIINQKSGGRTSSASANTLAGTSETNGRSSTTDSISQNAENVNSSEKKGKRYALSDSALNVDTEAEKAAWTTERMTDLIERYGARNPRYAQAYAVWVNPEDFVNATTTSQARRNQIFDEAGNLDIDALARESQTPFLSVDYETMRIVGHEGRHRMAALAKAGVKRVAVAIRFTEDSLSRYDARIMEGEHTFKGQSFSSWNAEKQRTTTRTSRHSVKVGTLIPINAACWLVRHGQKRNRCRSLVSELRLCSIWRRQAQICVWRHVRI